MVVDIRDQVSMDLAMGKASPLVQAFHQGSYLVPKVHWKKQGHLVSHLGNLQSHHRVAVMVLVACPRLGTMAAVHLDIRQDLLAVALVVVNLDIRQGFRAVVLAAAHLDIHLGSLVVALAAVACHLDTLHLDLQGILLDHLDGKVVGIPDTHHHWDIHLVVVLLVVGVYHSDILRGLMAGNLDNLQDLQSLQDFQVVSLQDLQFVAHRVHQAVILLDFLGILQAHLVAIQGMFRGLVALVVPVSHLVVPVALVENLQDLSRAAADFPLW